MARATITGVRIIEQSELAAISAGRIPNHVGCIMDGNGRWALSRGGSRSDGHRAAELAVASTVDAALEIGIQWLTLFAFSTENWQRPDDEVEFLMKFDEWLLREDRRTEFNAKGVRIRFAGRLDDARIPAQGREWIRDTEQLTEDNDKLTLCVAFNYGGKSELIDGIRRAAAAGEDLHSLTPERFERYLYIDDMPPVDLIIRTSAEYRVSNFFLWHSAYAEFVFSDTLWPDFRGWHLFSAVREYQSRMSRKGKSVAYSYREAEPSRAGSPS